MGGVVEHLVSPLEKEKKMVSNAKQELDRQEEQFAENLAVALANAGIKPDRYPEVEKACGFGSRTIELMLARKCRPQQRSIARIASYLKLSPENLWPTG